MLRMCNDVENNNKILPLNKQVVVNSTNKIPTM